MEFFSNKRAYQSLLRICAVLSLKASLCTAVTPIQTPTATNLPKVKTVAPDWAVMDAFQGSITAEHFQKLLTEVYAPFGGWMLWFHVVPTQTLLIRKTIIPELNEIHTFHFAENEAKVTFTPPLVSPELLASFPLLKGTCYWRPLSALPRITDPDNHPLEGVNIVIDPGHLGGRWAQMEERWFQIDKNPAVCEGDLNLRTAKLLAERLKTLGANVTLLRSNDEPLTKKRPLDFVEEAIQLLNDRGISTPTKGYHGTSDAHRQDSILWTAEFLFSREEIRARTEYVNAKIKPDLVLCLHYNAEPWTDPKRPTLSAKNHAHLAINGSYTPNEIARDDSRLAMLLKMFNGSHNEELALAESMGPALENATSLPAFSYTDKKTAIRAGNHPYIWLRNLLATRLYQCPCLYLECYVMNNTEVFDRIQLGDYEGRKEVHGRMRLSIYKEYVQGIADGLVHYYKNRTAVLQ